MFKVFNLTMSLLYQVHSWYKNFQNDKNTFISSINHAGLIFLNKSTFSIFILNTVTPWINHMVLLILSLSLCILCANTSKSIPGNKQPNQKFCPVISKTTRLVNECMTVSGKFNFEEEKPTRKPNLRFTNCIQGI